MLLTERIEQKKNKGRLQLAPEPCWSPSSLMCTCFPPPPPPWKDPLFCCFDGEA